MSQYINRTYDDTDTTNLIYSSGGFWNHGTWNASHTGETGTLSTSNILFDANLTFVFPEPAIGFYYYAIQRSRGAIYGICIDCDQNALNFETIDAVNATDDGKNPPVLLYAQRFSTPGIHRIILRNQPDTRFPNNNSQINIDSFKLEVLNPNPSPSIVTVTGSITSPASSSSSSSTQLASNVETTNVGAIVAGTLGGLAIILLILILLFWRWRRKRATSRGNMIADETYDPHVTPSPFHGSNHLRQSSSSMSEIPSMTTTRIVHAKGRHGFGANPSAHHDPSPSEFSSSQWTIPTTTDSSEAESLFAAITRRREVDAGPVGGPYDVGDILPPEYEQLFHRGTASDRLRGENVSVDAKS